MKVRDKLVVVTGAGSGIGRQLVLNLLHKGACVAAVDINIEGLNTTQRLCGPLARNLSLHQTDISNRDSVSRLSEDVISRHGRVDAIINNAGIIHAFKAIHELDDSVVERMINVNYYGVIHTTRAFLPLLLQRPVAHIVNLSSLGGLFAFPNQTLYGASKAAVKVFSEGLYAELRNTPVGVTVVFPGAIDTDITRNCGAHTEQIEKFNQYYKGTSADKAARCIIAGIEHNRFRVTIGLDAKILSVLYRIFPRLTILLIGKLMRAALAPTWRGDGS